MFNDNTHSNVTSGQLLAAFYAHEHFYVERRAVSLRQLSFLYIHNTTAVIVNNGKKQLAYA